MVKGQGWAAQQERLQRGACSVHGLFMGRVAGEYQLPDGDEQFHIVACPRGDCDMHGIQYDPDGPAEPLYPNVPVLAYGCWNYLDEDDEVQWGCLEPAVEIWPARLS